MKGAPKGNKNATGNTGGKSLQDRELAAAVRNLALNEIKQILEQDKMTVLKQQVILKLAGTVLPRLNEHSGADGGEITMKVVNYGNNDTLQLHTTPVPITTTTSD